MAKKQNSRKKDKKPLQKYKNLEDAYGKNKVSDQIKISKSIIIENNQFIKFCFMSNDPKQTSKIKKFNWSQLVASKINANLGQRTLQQKCLELIKGAKEFVCISSFLFENNTQLCQELYNVSKKGIRIYLLLASQLLLDRVKDDIEDNKNIKSHIQFLNEAGQGYIKSMNYLNNFFTDFMEKKQQNIDLIRLQRKRNLNLLVPFQLTLKRERTSSGLLINLNLLLKPLKSFLKL